MEDFHVHSNYSDGEFLEGMVRAAEAAGLEGIGFADHCNVAPRDRMEWVRSVYGFNLDITYDRRRRAIEHVRAETSIDVYDAVEMDYDPRDEAEIREFLAEAEFDYAVGSVHEVAGANVQVSSQFTDRPEAERDRIVEEYFDRLVSLIESELFDIAAHVDLVERTKPLRGRATENHYERVAHALAESQTVPEINAGRALTDDGIVHPAETFLETLRDHDIAVTVGTDSHAPDEIGGRADFLEAFFDDWGLEPVDPPALE
ncbi:PHP domain-containing protein [Natronobacterium gregoryi]|uniref:histidinol-phosphatase n=2 Tax=Natronobacterium gregoryi TaxID=44930 RepID=L0ANN1_NATGS|nr:PHP domain-containing protein [Natronobacterium gregoryi]AFZ74822.1 PHP family phosphohydrolase, histidinol phosphatase [Natronobacterium gregoryi SP2]ELY66155.1 PHP domain-containing protein [Natronobacterium gregoryi SP2]PLK19472.1 PHP domain-containing protein [Natronobacterium gregoryi SP2]SFJ43757.1 histidinol-phosphatase (PHP family) [Natronobacterium gregoryi]